MKRNQNLYLIGGAVLVLGAIVLRKSTAVKSLNVNVTKIDFNKKDRTFVVFVRLINPANAQITINSIVGDVIWRGTYGATMDYRIETIIPPSGEKTIQIPVKMNLEFITLLADLVKDKAKILNGTFEIKGVVNAEGLVVPLEYKKEIKLI
jgi:LEA14-like dessication related protein